MENYTPIINHYIALIKTEHFENNGAFINKIASQLIDNLHLKVVNSLTHQFKPVGITYIYVLSQSHLVIHTWPETGYIHIDLVTCQQTNKDDFVSALKKGLSELSDYTLKIKSVDYTNSSIDLLQI
jgi:S-adenosylmethionine/arginine decarboxylase-like enzyme